MALFFQVSKVGPLLRLITKEEKVSLILLLFSGKVLVVKVVNNDCRNMTYLFHVKVCLWQNSLNRLGMLVQYLSTIKSYHLSVCILAKQFEPYTLNHLIIFLLLLNFLTYLCNLNCILLILCNGAIQPVIFSPRYFSLGTVNYTASRPLPTTVPLVGSIDFLS